MTRFLGIPVTILILGAVALAQQRPGVPVSSEIQSSSMPAAAATTQTFDFSSTQNPLLGGVPAGRPGDQQRGLPVIIHTREADAETIDILEQEGAADAGGVIHCFTGGLELARRALAIGFYLSFSGIVAFPRAEVIQRVARECPEDRLLVETDAPFLAPPPHRGKRNEPAFVVEVARKLASLRGSSFEAVGGAVLRNYARLFRRPL